MSLKDQAFLSNIWVRKDRSNDVATPREAIEDVLELYPDLSWRQAQEHVQQTLLKNNQQVKTNIRIAQTTTTKRNCITVGQQWRWHQEIQKDFNLLGQENTGLYRCCGKTFGKMMESFIIGGDETTFMVCENGSGKVMAAGGRTKH